MRALLTAAASVVLATVPSVAASAVGNPFPGPVGGARLGTAPVVLADGATPPAVKAGAWLVADLDTGEVLAARAPHARLRPASTLKTLTALVLLPRLDKSDRVTGRYEDAAIEGSKVGIHPGLVYSVEQLFQGMFLASGNDAVHALAVHDQGGLPATVRRMNAAAAQLGAFDTQVVDPTGLDQDGQLSSAYDLALIARAGMQRADFRRYAATLTVQFPLAPKDSAAGRPTEPSGSYQVGNQNRLLWNYPGALGIKTGFTTLARNTFIGAAERDGRRLVVTLLNSPHGVTKDAATLLDWTFTHRSRLKPIGSLVTAEQVAAARHGNRPVVRTSAGAGEKREPAAPRASRRDDPAARAAAQVPLWSYAVPPALLSLVWVRHRRRPVRRAGARRPGH